MAYIKLIKLLYLAERQAMARWGESMSGDSFVSMPHGPVLSQTYDLIKSDASKAWDSLIKGEANYEVSLAREINRETLDELSDAELTLLDEVFSEFGKMSRFEIVDYTHDHCPEWEDPHGSSYPINPENIIRANVKDQERLAELLAFRKQQVELNRVKSLLS